MSEADQLLTGDCDARVELAPKHPVYNSVYYLTMTTIVSIVVYFSFMPIDEGSSDYRAELVERMAIHSLLFAMCMVCTILVHYLSKLVIKRTQDAGYFSFSMIYQLVTEAYLQLSFLLFIIFVILIGRLRDSEDDEEDYEHIRGVIISQKVAVIIELVFSATALILYCAMDIYWWRFNPQIDIFSDLTFSRHLPFLSLLEQSNKIDVFYSNQGNINDKIRKYAHLSSQNVANEETEKIKNDMLVLRDDVEEERIINSHMAAELKNLRMRIEEAKRIQDQLDA